MPSNIYFKQYEDIVENKLNHLSQQDQEIIQEQYQSLKDILTTADKCWSAYHNGRDFEVLENIRQLKSSLIEVSQHLNGIRLMLENLLVLLHTVISDLVIILLT